MFHHCPAVVPGGRFQGLVVIKGPLAVATLYTFVCLFITRQTGRTWHAAMVCGVVATTMFTQEGEIKHSTW